MPVTIDFSYSQAAETRMKRLLVHAVERVTGQPRLKRLYFENQKTPDPNESFWEAAIRLLRLRLHHPIDGRATIPAEGPLVFVANHPFGVVDGIVISHLVSQARADFKILTNSVLNRAPEVMPYILPVDFADTRQAVETNLETRRQAIALLKRGGALAVFPGGAVSTAYGKPFGKAVDPTWKPFTARVIQMSRATVIPMYFDGQNSRLFQIASNVSQTLRYALLFKEVRNKMGRTINVRIGEAIPYDDLAHMTDRQVMIAHLRELTYRLGQRPVAPPPGPLAPGAVDPSLGFGDLDALAATGDPMDDRFRLA